MQRHRKIHNQCMRFYNFNLLQLFNCSAFCNYPFLKSEVILLLTSLLFSTFALSLYKHMKEHYLKLENVLHCGASRFGTAAVLYVIFQAEPLLLVDQMNHDNSTVLFNCPKFFNCPLLILKIFLTLCCSLQLLSLNV